MPADGAPLALLFALEVVDQASYARYRAAMTPILESHGGDFGHDFVVAEVRRGRNVRVNRVFTVRFPDRAAKQRFFADPAYRAVRAAHYEPAVADTQLLGEVVADGSPR